MKVFEDPKFGFRSGEKLNFEFIHKQGLRYILLVDDIVSLAKKHKLFDHTIDSKAKEKLDSFIQKKEQTV